MHQEGKRRSNYETVWSNTSGGSQVAHSSRINCFRHRRKVILGDRAFSLLMLGRGLFRCQMQIKLPLSSTVTDILASGEIKLQMVVYGRSLTFFF
ncbi:hypothetical protein NPIL_549301 [Nephila pilipes]|uniref:Uncharacterized protein n=1 Tax=Nephila pilipes TaxID=299642 RepID=A0A8X6Q255_NEPPI|nr:hypothetical protein NPIL_549301 [Nephila pilipes]